MKYLFIDNYTKGVLTIIALCLLALTVNEIGLFPVANANDSQNLVTTNGKYGIVPLNEDGTISVKLVSAEEIDVNISGITTRDELEVNLVEIGGGYIPFGGPILVEVD